MASSQMRYGDRQSIEDTIVITKVPTRSYDRDRRTLMPPIARSRRMKGSIRSCTRAAPGLSLCRGLRLLEHGARAFQVIGGNHDLRGAERGVGKIDVDVCVGELPGQLAERHGPVLDRDHQDLTLVSDSDPGLLK